MIEPGKLIFFGCRAAYPDDYGVVELFASASRYIAQYFYLKSQLLLIVAMPHSCVGDAAGVSA